MDGWIYGGCCDRNSVCPALTEPLTMDSEMTVQYQVPASWAENLRVAESGIFDLNCVSQTILRRSEISYLIPFISSFLLNCHTESFSSLEGWISSTAVHHGHRHQFHFFHELQWLIGSGKQGVESRGH